MATTLRAEHARMRKLAFAALDQFDLRVARIRLSNHGFNTTYKVLTEDGQMFALRINLNSRKSPSDVLAEIEWIEALAKQGKVAVARPIRTIAGDKFAKVDAGEGRVSIAVLFSWLPGKVKDEPSGKQVYAMGQAMAYLHASGRTWRPSSKASLPRIDDIFMGLENNISGDSRVGKDVQALVAKTLEICEETFAALKSRFDVQPLHADLHPGNVLWHEGTAAVIDFDDMGLGLVAQDIAIAIYYLRGEGDREAKFLAGYESVAPLPHIENHELEALIASRNIMLMSDLIVADNTELQEMVPRYVVKTSGNLQRYLSSGQFTFES